MAFDYIEYIYPTELYFEKILTWMDSVARIYFALKTTDEDDWTYFSGNAAHGLASGSFLVNRGSVEADAQTNYWKPTPDSDDRTLGILPGLIPAKYVRIYVDDTNDAPTVIHEFRPSSYFAADEIVTGQLKITDQLSQTPSIKITVSSQERLFLGNLGSGVYGIRGRDSSDNIIFELKSDSDVPFLQNYADLQALELDGMKVNFQSISWAQFAVFDPFKDETKRASPDPSAFDARVYQSKIDNNEDDTNDRAFGFVSKTYTDITVVETGTSTSVGLNFLTDTNKAWFTDEVKNLTLIDSGSATFNVTSNTNDTLTVVGTPAAGAYKLKDDNPAYAVAFCSYKDSTLSGGTGFVKMEVSFDNGGNYQTFLDTDAGTNLLGATVAIANPGDDYITRLTLTNDGSGDGAIVYNFLVCTDPSPWRW